MKKVQMSIGILIGLTVLFGTMAKFESRYARADVVDSIRSDVDRHKVEVRMEKLQERMWAIEDRWADKFMAEKNRIHDSMEELLHFMTPEAREEYRRLEQEYEKLSAKMKETDDE